MSVDRRYASLGHAHDAASLLKDSLTAGDILYVNSDGDLALLPAGNEDGVLTIINGVPAWSGGLTTPVTIPEFPTATVWTTYVTSLGGAAPAATVGRYWDRPVYPSSFTTTVSSISALNTAIAAASPGDVIALSSGTYSGKVTIAVDGTAANPITVCAATKGGADMGESEIQIDGDYVTVCGFTDAWFDINGSWGLIHDNTCNGPYTASQTFAIFAGRYNRLCYNTFDAGNYQVFSIPTVGVKQYHRIDHNRMTNHTGGVSGASEIGQIGQNNEDNYAHDLVDHNYIYLHDPSAYSEGELISNKSRGNGFIRNIVVDCHSKFNDRTARDALYYANYISGTNESNAGGITMQDNAISACNIMYDFGSAGVDATCALSWSEGDNSTYFPADTAEGSFNSIVECYKCIDFGKLGAGTSPVHPNNPIMYNNAAELNALSGSNTVWNYEITGTLDAGGNIFSAPDGITDSGVTEGTPGWTVTGGFPLPDDSGNLEAAAVSGYNSTIITVDFFGSPIPGAGANIGAIQPDSYQYVHSSTLTNLIALAGPDAA